MRIWVHNRRKDLNCLMHNLAVLLHFWGISAFYVALGLNRKDKTLKEDLVDLVTVDLIGGCRA